jgi:hypothetical protein
VGIDTRVNTNSGSLSTHPKGKSGLALTPPFPGGNL